MRARGRYTFAPGNAGYAPTRRFSPDGSAALHAAWFGDEVEAVTSQMTDRRDGQAYHNVQIGIRFAGGGYAPMGLGGADIAGVAHLLAARGYAGWFVAEEESESSGADPAAAVAASRRYLRAIGY